MVLHQQLHKQRTNYQRQISRCNSNRMEYKIVAVKAQARIGLRSTANTRAQKKFRMIPLQKIPRNRSLFSQDR